MSLLLNFAVATSINAYVSKHADYAQGQLNNAGQPLQGQCLDMGPCNFTQIACDTLGTGETNPAGNYLCKGHASYKTTSGYKYVGSTKCNGGINYQSTCSCYAASLQQECNTSIFPELQLFEIIISINLPRILKYQL